MIYSVPYKSCTKVSKSNKIQENMTLLLSFSSPAGCLLHPQAGDVSLWIPPKSPAAYMKWIIFLAHPAGSSGISATSSMTEEDFPPLWDRLQEVPSGGGGMEPTVAVPVPGCLLLPALLLPPLQCTWGHLPSQLYTLNSISDSASGKVKWRQMAFEEIKEFMEKRAFLLPQGGLVLFFLNRTLSLFPQMTKWAVLCQVWWFWPGRFLYQTF